MDAEAWDGDVSLVRFFTPAVVGLLLAGALCGRLEVTEPAADVETVHPVCLVPKLFTFQCLLDAATFILNSSYRISVLEDVDR